uniref:Evasin n=1 Tax=Rhipicephalus appendiculatus TaxID=34631 RepID=A0A131YF99_RHIAP
MGAYQIVVGCKNVCNGEKPVKDGLSGRPCLMLPLEALRYGRQGVNYTCILGECDESNDCKDVDLLIDCWQPTQKPKIKKD